MRLSTWSTQSPSANIYGGRDESEAIDNGIRRHHAGIDALSEELAQEEQPTQADGPTRREATTINPDLTTTTGQRDALNDSLSSSRGTPSTTSTI